MIERYWISATPSNWNNTANWSNASGGPGGLSIPDSTTKVFFDSNGNGNCTMDISVYILGLNVSGYGGNISQNNQSILLDSSAFFDDGTFTGNGADIKITGDLDIGGNCSFISTDSTLSCDSTFTFNSSVPFNSNNGVVSLDSTGCLLDATGTSFSTLQCNGDRVSINEIVYVQDLLVLKSGSAKSSARLFLRGDMSCQSSYNQWNDFNDIDIRFDGSTTQNLVYQSGGVIPSIYVDKDATTPKFAHEPIQVKCRGDSPIIIKDMLYIQDGTFNMNGLDIQIGL